LTQRQKHRRHENNADCVRKVCIHCC
jgi:hypothetical protein